MFLFVAEALSLLLKDASTRGALQEFHLNRQAPGISHLLFADDSMLFFKGSIDQAIVIKNILTEYEKGTGQLLSPDKCSMMFGKKCSLENQVAIMVILKITVDGFKDKYLGLPVPEERMKAGKFQSTKEKVLKRLSDWIEKYASCGVKEDLIKSVIQALPVYAMGIFKFPASLCEELTQIIRNFWWGDEEDRRKTHWLAWDKLTRSKGKGGMGFRDLRLFNQALLAKQAWRLLVHPDSLCAKLMKAKYYPHGHILDTVFPQSASVTWQGIMHGLELLKNGVIWRVGDGSSINIWRDN